MKDPIKSLSFEALDTSDILATTACRIAIESEAVREGVGSWMDSVLHDVANHRRHLFIAHANRTLAGYMILKPWDQKISSIWVDKNFRGWGVGQKFYGMGVVNLSVSFPYTAFVHDMRDEMMPLVHAYSLVLDDTGPLIILNPGEDADWTKEQDAQIAPKAHEKGADTGDTPPEPPTHQTKRFSRGFRLR